MNFKKLKITLGLLVILNLMSPGFAQDEHNHPELDWQTFETEHFYVHFHLGTERTALLVAKIAEDIYRPVTELYRYKPAVKIHFIIKDTDDYSNGGAYFFDDKIEIWAENLDYIMRGTKNWLRDVVTHEFTHMIQIQSSLKFPKYLPYGFFQFFGYEPERRTDVVRGFPNVLVSYPLASVNIPVWYAEGVAQHQATGARFDYRDPNREMILRDRVIHGQMLTYNEMGVFGKNSHGNESAYNLGFAFVNYISDRFGEQVISDISNYNSEFWNLTFEQSIKQATGLSSHELYSDWLSALETDYKNRLSSIRAGEVSGKLIESEGFANLYPVWSPNDKQIAYISNKGYDSFGQNGLYIFNTETGEKKMITSRVSSSIAWSPDGKYLLYSRHSVVELTGSAYNDLYVYDFQNEKEIRISKSLRGKNPDWSNDGKRIIYVGETNGLNQLFCFEIAEDLSKDNWTEYFVDIETGILKQAEENNHRKIQIKGSTLQQFLVFENNRQIYHPRWSPDDKQIVFDTATDYGRDIALYDLAAREYEMILSGTAEERYPVFAADGSSIYFTSGETGIYNIYEFTLQTGEKTLLTNVTGGAVMPSVNRQGDLVFALYDSLGYKISLLKSPKYLDKSQAIYDSNYSEKIPDKNFDDSNLIEPKIREYKQSFTHLNFLPRVLIDYGTVKPGFYMYSTDVLNKMSLIAGAAINSKLDYDLFGLFEYRELYPTLYLEVYNSSVNINDSLMIKRGEDNYEEIEQDINFDLTEVAIGATGKWDDWLKWRLAYVVSRYSAKIKWFDPSYNDIITFRYPYLKGASVQLSLISDMTQYSRFSAISPAGGRYVNLKYAYEDNDFLESFDTGKSLGIEVFGKHAFHRVEMDWEEYFRNPLFENHAFSLRLNAGYIDRPVDDFFHLFAGGLLGMKGYSYFSLEGRKKLIATFTYRLPLFTNIDWQIMNVHFDKLFLGGFIDYGNAWIENEIGLNDFKRDIGIQLRLETFTNYLFPTRVFFEAAYPLDEAVNQNVQYKQEWRYYFGILFDFDFRERFSGLKRNYLN